MSKILLILLSTLAANVVWSEARAQTPCELIPNVMARKICEQMRSAVIAKPASPTPADGGDTTSTQGQVSPKPSRPNDEPANQLTPKDQNENRSVARTSDQVGVTGTDDAGTQKSARFKSLSKDAQEKLLGEVKFFYNHCRRSGTYATYHDCQCLSEKYVDTRLAIDPDPNANMYTVMHPVSERIKYDCPNKPGIVRYSYNECKTGLLIGKDTSERFCTCFANKVADLYAANPKLDLAYRADIELRAKRECRSDMSSTQTQVSRETPRPNDKTSMHETTGDQNGLGSVASTTGRVGVSGAHDESPQDSARFKSLSKDSQKKLLDEVDAFYKRCNGSGNYASYHDCQCLSVKFLDTWLAMGPKANQYKVSAKIENECPNKPGIVRFSKAKCNTNFVTNAPQGQVERFCTCFANKVADLYAANPKPDLNYQANIDVRAMRECRKGGRN